MIVYPVIELQGGKCVSLRKGRLDEPQLWPVDPVEAARGFVVQGAEWLHVTDLDAVAGSGSNAALIREIILHAEAPVQIAGGVRTMARVEEWAEAGAARIVIGTAGVKDPALVRSAARAHPDQIALAVDSWRGKVMCEGWTESSLFDPVDFALLFEDAPLAAIVFTDIDRDVDHPEPSLALTTELAARIPTPVISRGLVKTLDDLSRLRYLPNIHGAMVGEALFRKSLDLAEAVRTARAGPEPVAPLK